MYKNSNLGKQIVELTLDRGCMAGRQVQASTVSGGGACVRICGWTRVLVVLQVSTVSTEAGAHVNCTIGVLPAA